jgi:hypothetical protein
MHQSGADQGRPAAGRATAIAWIRHSADVWSSCGPIRPLRAACARRWTETRRTLERPERRRIQPRLGRPVCEAPVVTLERPRSAPGRTGFCVWDSVWDFARDLWRVAARSEAADEGRKRAITRQFVRWRDPDSNRGHHDFQSCGAASESDRFTGVFADVGRPGDVRAFPHFAVVCRVKRPTAGSVGLFAELQHALRRADTCDRLAEVSRVMSSVPAAADPDEFGGPAPATAPACALCRSARGCTTVASCAAPSGAPGARCAGGQDVRRDRRAGVDVDRPQRGLSKRTTRAASRRAHPPRPPNVPRRRAYSGGGARWRRAREDGIDDRGSDAARAGRDSSWSYTKDYARNSWRW